MHLFLLFGLVSLFLCVLLLFIHLCYFFIHLYLLIYLGNLAFPSLYVFLCRKYILRLRFLFCVLSSFVILFTHFFHSPFSTFHSPAESNPPLPHPFPFYVTRSICRFRLFVFSFLIIFTLISLILLLNTTLHLFRFLFM